MTDPEIDIETGRFLEWFSSKETPPTSLEIFLEGSKKIYENRQLAIESMAKSMAAESDVDVDIDVFIRIATKLFSEVEYHYIRARSSV